MIKKIYYKISNIFRYYSPIYIDNIFRCIETYWKCRKIYKFPKISVSKSKGTWFNDLFSTCRLFSIISFDIMWKWKWDEVTFEDSPRMYITFLGKYQITLYFNSPIKEVDENTYWESMLNYLYMYNKDLKETRKNWFWINQDDTTTWNNKMLTKYGKNILKENND